MAETIYDVAIIGSGPAGYTAAIRAGEYGLKTCLIEKDDLLGGTCLHVGCIPTKALLFNAEIWDHLKNAKEFGIEGITAPKLNWAAVQQRKNKIVLKHAKGLEFLMRKNKVTTVNGYGRLTGGATDGVHTVEVFTAGGGGAGGETTFIKAKNILISTGSEARMLPGLEPDARSRQVFSFHRPEELIRLVMLDQQPRAKLRSMPPLDRSGVPSAWNVMSSGRANQKLHMFGGNFWNNGGVVLAERHTVRRGTPGVPIGGKPGVLGAT